MNYLVSPSFEYVRHTIMKLSFKSSIVMLLQILHVNSQKMAKAAALLPIDITLVNTID